MIKQARYLDKRLPSLKGRVFLVTGSSSGLGLEAAKSLLYKEATVIFAVRSLKKTEKAIAELRKDIPSGETHIEVYDQSQAASISALAERLKSQRLDAVILNAGIYYPVKGAKGEDGTSLTFYVNAVGSYRLYHLLRQDHPESRYVFVTSVANKAPRNHDYSSCLGSGGDKRFREYSNSKRAMMDLFAYSLVNEKYNVYLTHPGVSSTGIFDSYPPIIRKMGHSLLDLVVHKAWKACLNEVLMAAGDYPRGTFSYPRGLFQISGYPHPGHLPKHKLKRDGDNLQSVFSEHYHL